MKRYLILLLLISFCGGSSATITDELSSESSGVGETTTIDNSKSEVKYQIDTESVSLKWVAYKTTAKLGVGGEFGKINIGETIIFGNFSQQGLEIKEDMRVIEYVKNIAENFCPNGEDLSLNTIVSLLEKNGCLDEFKQSHLRNSGWGKQ
mgnify:CR=1 FL=1